ncbi:hypothetical protein PTTG_05052 [Puccinia triticina 1-1 BBBD Race 1]|uniref:Uncharacterized protein n=1 Tax=Puccinia triticina (isolate 1-1 / race 1 (BBBD)) TaxID=630390 RepID=A0A0C4EW62_PUCT1|nr:hypothetical protein PTTG_05052 [Puccinia triticina 1-1 BBBD Race 1]
MNFNSGPVRRKSKYQRLKGWHAKRATNSSDAIEDSAETSQLRDCLNTNGSGSTCLNASTSAALSSTSTALPSASTVLPSTSPVFPPNNATNTGASTSVYLAPNSTANTGSSASGPITHANATTTTAHPGTFATNSRLGWKIGLVAPLIVILFIISLVIRHKMVKKRNMREKWQEVGIHHDLGGEKRHQAARESQKETKGIHPKGTREDNLQAQEILSTPELARRKEPSQPEMLGLERGCQVDKEDNRSRKSSVASRFSLRSFSLRPPMDMSVFQTRTDAALDTIQLEIKHRERMSKMK